MEAKEKKWWKRPEYTVGIIAAVIGAVGAIVAAVIVVHSTADHQPTGVNTNIPLPTPSVLGSAWPAWVLEIDDKANGATTSDTPLSAGSRSIRVDAIWWFRHMTIKTMADLSFPLFLIIPIQKADRASLSPI